MQVDARLPQSVQEKSERKDPSKFVMSMALTLLAVTLIAVLMMQLATEYRWQLL